MVFSFLRFSNKLKKVFCELVTSTTTTTTTATKERTNERRRFRFPPLLSALQQTRRRSLKCGRQKNLEISFLLKFSFSCWSRFMFGHIFCSFFCNLTTLTWSFQNLKLRLEKNCSIRKWWQIWQNVIDHKSLVINQ